MEIKADIVIVGAGIAGLATALALHRLGIQSVVVESSGSLRAAGVALTTWTNAWKAMDALGVSHSLRQHHTPLLGIAAASTVTGEPNSYVSFSTKGKHGDHQVSCVRRKALLETLANELPSGTIRFSAKVLSIEGSGFSKLLHLSDGTILRTKVLIGCDGVNSVVAKWLGFKVPSLTGRSAIRGCAYYEGSHGIDNKFQKFIGGGIRFGVIPCDGTAVYWFFTWSPSTPENKILEEADQGKLKQLVLDKLGNVPDHIRSVVEVTEVEEIVGSPLRYRAPWEILWGNISKDNVCVAGDACHPMTPDLGQGGCLALEDGIILSKCLVDALSGKPSGEPGEMGEYEYERIKSGLSNYAKRRKWRAVDVVVTSYIVGLIEESNGIGMRFIREKILSAFISNQLLNKADVDPSLFSL